MLLTSDNAFDYLVTHKLCAKIDKTEIQIKPLVAKNFNLLVTLPESCKFLIKQERRDKDGKTANEFQVEWNIQVLIKSFEALNDLSPFLPEVLHFDEENSVIVFQFLDQYSDLAEFYGRTDIYPIKVAKSLGHILATIHRSTFKQQDYYERFATLFGTERPSQVTYFVKGLQRISPEIFGSVPSDGLKFFALYQRYDSLGLAVAELGDAFSPCCIAHSDLKLNNVLLANDWQAHEGEVVRLIDWERAEWGDPAFDLGMLIGSYIQLWLGSIVISQALSIEESLRLATIPLENLQPSIAALAMSYCEAFPEILEERPDFLKRVIQFAGLSLIQQIQAMIQYQKAFGNMGIAMLQVAKSLLCRPEQSMSTVFGESTQELLSITSVPI